MCGLFLLNWLVPNILLKTTWHMSRSFLCILQILFTTENNISVYKKNVQIMTFFSPELMVLLSLYLKYILWLNSLKVCCC